MLLNIVLFFSKTVQNIEILQISDDNNKGL